MSLEDLDILQVGGGNIELLSFPLPVWLKSEGAGPGGGGGSQLSADVMCESPGSSTL